MSQQHGVGRVGNMIFKVIYLINKKFKFFIGDPKINLITSSINLSRENTLECISEYKRY